MTDMINFMYYTPGNMLFKQLSLIFPGINIRFIRALSFSDRPIV